VRAAIQDTEKMEPIDFFNDKAAPGAMAR